MKHSRLLLAGVIGLVLAGSVSAATVNVPANFGTIQAAVDGSVSGDTITVDAGTYNENVIVNKQLTLLGAQAGVDACGRSATESVISAVSGNLLRLVAGSAGTMIDGFTFSGGVKGIESSTGPIDNLQILNNRFVGFTSSGIFLNDNGVDITVHQNDIDGSSQAGGGGILHLDTDNFDGFHLTENCIANGDTGFFVDGNRNVGIGGRNPLFDGNLFENNGAGMNVGQRAVEDATFSNNQFLNNLGDGLQGGPKDSLITLNVFDGNGRNGLRFGFGNTSDPTKSANGNTVTLNCFTGNGYNDAVNGAGIRVGAAFAGQSATNVFNNNNFRANFVGMLNQSVDANIDAEDNFWGAADGPSGDGTGSGDSVLGTGAGGSIDFDPFLVAADAGAPACLPPPLPSQTTWGLIGLALLLLAALAGGTALRRQRLGA